jgi:hypothetical protein
MILNKEADDDEAAIAICLTKEGRGSRSYDRREGRERDVFCTGWPTNVVAPSTLRRFYANRFSLMTRWDPSASDFGGTPHTKFTVAVTGTCCLGTTKSFLVLSVVKSRQGVSTLLFSADRDDNLQVIFVVSKL